jgi:UDP-N-acetylglucosamine transferase subunit ALG13
MESLLSSVSTTTSYNSKTKHDDKIIFVTVGTTLFTSLIDNIIHPNTIQCMIQYGYTHLIIQYGKGIKPSITLPTTITTTQATLQYELYDFKPSLYDDMVKADVIICHAGAGTLTEAIRISQQQQQQQKKLINEENLKSLSTNNNDRSQMQQPKRNMKKIITVINNILMDNHQTELAYALQRRQLVYVIDDPMLLSTTTLNTNNNMDLTTTTTMNTQTSTSTIWEQIESFQPSTQTSLQGNPYDIPRRLHHFFVGTNNNNSTDSVVKKEE